MSATVLLSAALKDIGKIFVYLAALILLGALLAPPLFWSAHFFARHLANQRLTDFLVETNFQRFFNRAVLIAAIVLLWPLARSLRIRNFGEDLGLHRDRRGWRHFFSGLMLALATMAVLGGFLLVTDLYQLKNVLPWGRLAWLPLTALTVAVLEEWLFRGVLQGVVQRGATDEFATMFIAVLFAAVHFLKPAENALAPQEITWSSGLALVPQAFWQFEQPRLLLGGFSTIFLVALILGYARWKTHALWMPIGLHAGWILGKMSFSKITKRLGDAWPWFGTDILAGFGPVLVLLLAGVIVWFWLRHAHPR